MHRQAGSEPRWWPAADATGSWPRSLLAPASTQDDAVQWTGLLGDGGQGRLPRNSITETYGIQPGAHNALLAQLLGVQRPRSRLPGNKFAKLLGAPQRVQPVPRLAEPAKAFKASSTRLLPKPVRIVEPLLAPAPVATSAVRRESSGMDSAKIYRPADSAKLLLKLLRGSK